jgi:hypothetical protein
MIYVNQLQYFMTNGHQWTFDVIGGLCEIAVIFEIIILIVAVW